MRRHLPAICPLAGLLATAALSLGAWGRSAAAVGQGRDAALGGRVLVHRWDRLPSGAPAGVSIMPASAPEARGAGGAVLRVQGRPHVRTTVTVLVIHRPALPGRIYALMGRVRYEGVVGTGYLETWNHFPDGSRYFSRTLAAAGPVAALRGTSSWRRFSVPFDARRASGPPVRIELNVVLPGAGTVWLGPVTLVAVGASPARPRGFRRDAGPPPASRRPGEGRRWLWLWCGGILALLAVAPLLFGRGRGRPRALRWMRSMSRSSAGVCAAAALLAWTTDGLPGWPPEGLAGLAVGFVGLGMVAQRLLRRARGRSG